MGKRFNVQMAQYNKPTIEGENTLTLENNVKSILPHLEIDGNTYQQTYSGYNLFDIFAFKAGESKGYTIDENGVVTFIESTADIRYGVNITFPAGTYIISATGTTGCLVGGPLFAGGGNYGWVGAGTPSKTFTFTEEKTYPVYIVKTEGNNGGTLSNIQINKGSTVKPYEPYVGGIASPNYNYPQDIVNAGDNGVEVVVKSANEIHYEDKTARNDGTTSAITIFFSYAYELKPSTTYTLSFDYIFNELIGTPSFDIGRGVSWYNIDIKQSISFPNLTQGRFRCTFTTPVELGDRKYLFFRLRKRSNTEIVDITMTNIQLVIGDIDLPYSPYFKPTTLSIPSAIDDLELRFARYDDTRKDTLIIDGLNKKVIYKQRLDKITIPADKWTTQYYYSGSMGIYASNVLGYKGTRFKGFCSHANKKQVNDVETYSPGGVWLGVNSKFVFWIGIISLLGYDSDWVNKSAPTADEWATARDKFQAFMREQEDAGHPFECVYVIPTPVEHDITETDLGRELLNIVTGKGTNILEISNAEDLAQTFRASHLTHK